jgi:colanic acid biosynthesis glycosyl transferase WcaI
MKILVYTLNFSPEITGIGKYCGEMVEWLSQNNHEVRVITAYPYYPRWKVLNGYSSKLWSLEKIDGIKIFRCPLWVPKTPSGFKRLIHLFSFALTSFPILFFHLFWRPSIIFITEPPFFCTPSAILFSKLARCKSWLHVQDFEIDAAFEAKILQGNFAKSIALTFEKVAFKQFDVISTLSGQMLRRLKHKGCDEDKTFLMPNWVNLMCFDRDMGKSFNFRKFLSIPSRDILALYSGSMGAKQGLEILAEVASLSEKNGKVDGKSIHFLFCGDGPGKGALLEACVNLRYVHFLDLQPSDRFPALLSSADIHLLPQIDGVGDLVLPSKLSGMLASGRSVIATARIGSEIGDVVQKCGYIVEPGDISAFYQAMVRLASNDSLREEFGRLAKNYATIHLDRNTILNDFQDRLFAITLN